MPTKKESDVAAVSLQVRMKAPMRERLAAAAKASGNSMNSEILVRLERSLTEERAVLETIRAVLGGEVGGGSGYYMEQQEMMLRQVLEGTGVRVERIGDSIRLIMPGNVTFPTGSYVVEQGFYPTLNSVAKVLVKFDKTVVNVDGFTDSTGSFESNQTLSERRAASVAQYLAGSGVAPLRLQSRGYGERYPVASNDTAGGRAMNRRVEVNIRGTQK